MSMMIIPFLVLGPGLLIASLVVKSTVVRTLCLLGGTVILLWFTRMLAGIPMMYEREHRNAENNYHRQIIARLDVMLADGQTNEARVLAAKYLETTQGASFMRNPLHELVKSLEAEKTEPVALPALPEGAASE